MNVVEKEMKRKETKERKIIIGWIERERNMKGKTRKMGEKRKKVSN